ncbi:MAG: Rrf2 family transcriptional regulator [Lachnospiraceae bacterium]|nr:Rrf2 family transcriptional regulator [Lachnospiraceae bacterium]
MIISTRGKNALKLMLDLATYNTGEMVRLKDIAKRQDISEKYLEQIVSGLMRASLVNSVRGKNGGYTLRYEPKDYTVGQIIKAVENDMAPTDCYGKNSPPCPNKATCANYRLWGRLDMALNDVLEGITLADMLDWQRELYTDQYVI